MLQTLSASFRHDDWTEDCLGRSLSSVLGVGVKAGRSVAQISSPEYQKILSKYADQPFNLQSIPVLVMDRDSVYT